MLKFFSIWKPKKCCDDRWMLRKYYIYHRYLACISSFFSSLFKRHWMMTEICYFYLYITSIFWWYFSFSFRLWLDKFWLHTNCIAQMYKRNVSWFLWKAHNSAQQFRSSQMFIQIVVVVYLYGIPFFTWFIYY